MWSKKWKSVDQTFHKKIKQVEKAYKQIKYQKRLSANVLLCPVSSVCFINQFLWLHDFIKEKNICNSSFSQKS